MNRRLYSLVEISLLAAFISVTGSLKIPTLILGSEFQLSAPIAVAICAVFGFKRYLIAGILSSCLLLMLGLHSPIHVGVAMIFRLVVGLVITISLRHPLALIVAGPLGTLSARYVLSIGLQIPLWPLLIGALPGMVITAIVSLPLTKYLKKIHDQFGVTRYEQAI